MSVPDVYHRYNRPQFEGEVNVEESMTHQEFKDECDVNRIMARYLKTGVFPEGMDVGRYGDFSEVPDYIEAQNLLIRASEQFAGLPAKVRDRFKNDPGEFLKYVHSKDVNLDECQEWGILSDEAVKRRDGEKAAAKKAAEDKIAADAVAAHEAARSKPVKLK